MSQFKPDHLHFVPQFDENSDDLNRYLSCQSLTDSYNASNTLDFKNNFLLNNLVGKLSGKHSFKSKGH